MRYFKIEINGVDYTEQCSALSFTKYAKSIGRWDGRLEGIHGLVGRETVKIYDDDNQVFQGRIGTPVKENTPSGSGMPVGGMEWTAKLQDYLTDYAVLDDATLTEALTEVLKNSPFGIDTLDELSETEVEVNVWETTLDFLDFTFSNACIVYDTTVEVTDEPATGTYEVPDSNRRHTFYDKADGYFYIVAYDNTASLLKYNSTANFSTWKGWTSLGFNAGNNGTFGIAWDEANGLLYLLADDGANIDFYEYTTDSTGTLTQTDTDANVDAGDLVCGPIVDNNSDVVWICDDGTNYCLWRFEVATNTWTREITWLISNNDDPKYIFRSNTDDEDCIVIMFDDDNNEVEEWLYDHTGGTLTETRVITSVTTCGYVCGYQDNADNMFIIWEDSDLYFSRKDIDATSWESQVKIVDSSDYSTTNMFSLGGDYAQNLYLFYLNDDGVTRTIDIIRRYEETWGSTVTINTDADTTSRPRVPADGLAMFVAWLDTGDDPNLSLLDPVGIGVYQNYGAAEEDHSYESGLDFDGTNVWSGCSLTASTAWSSDGVQSMRSYTPAAPSTTKTAQGRYSGFNLEEAWTRSVIKVTEAASWGIDDKFTAVFGVGASGYLFWAGWEDDGAGNKQWWLQCRNGTAYVNNNAGTPVVGTEYCIEVHWVKGAAGVGYCDLYVDGSSMIASGVQDTDNYGNLEEVNFGLQCYDRDGDTVLFMDQNAVSGNRIGCAQTGWFRTETYTASGSMINWGTLDSTDDDDNNTSWGIWDTTPTLIVDDLITGVDLEGAGVDNTETQIQIRADLQNGESRTYVQDIRLGEKQGLIDVTVDYEWCSTAIKKIADILGYEYKLGWDNKLDMVEQLGRDQSDYIILKTAKSDPYPEVEPNIVVINRDPDFQSFANGVYVKGSGDIPNRKWGSAQDQDSQDTYGVKWISLTNKDCTTNGMCTTYAKTELAARKDPVLRMDVQFYDDYDSGDIDIGDIITVVDDEIGINQTARVVALSYGWGSGGRVAQASLTANLKAKTFVELLAKISDLERWV
jgi:hypothetical protein